MHSTLPAAQGDTTLEITLNLARALPDAVPVLRVDGTLVQGGRPVATSEARIIGLAVNRTATDRAVLATDDFESVIRTQVVQAGAPMNWRRPDPGASASRAPAPMHGLGPGA